MFTHEIGPWYTDNGSMISRITHTMLDEDIAVCITVDTDTTSVKWSLSNIIMILLYKDLQASDVRNLQMNGNSFHSTFSILSSILHQKATISPSMKSVHLSTGGTTHQALKAAKS